MYVVENEVPCHLAINSVTPAFKILFIYLFLLGGFFFFFFFWSNLRHGEVLWLGIESMPPAVTMPSP